MPGLQDPERAKRLIGNTAQLDFRLVSAELRQDQLEKVFEDGRVALSLAKDDTKPESIQKISQWARDNGKISKAVTIMLEREMVSEVVWQNFRLSLHIWSKHQQNSLEI